MGKIKELDKNLQPRHLLLHNEVIKTMLKAFIKDLSGIPEESQALYKKHEDGYIVNIEAVDGYALEDLAPLKSTLNRLKGDITGYKDIIGTIPEGFDFGANERKLAQLAKQQDFDPDKVRLYIDKVKIFFYKWDTEYVIGK